MRAMIILRCSALAFDSLLLRPFCGNQTDPIHTKPANQSQSGTDSEHTIMSAMAYLLVKSVYVISLYLYFSRICR